LFTVFIKEIDLSKTPKKAIIIGASSGIGRAIALKLSKENYEVGIVGRREELLNSLSQELATRSYIKCMDVAKTDESVRMLNDLINEMGKVDLFIISAGIGSLNPELEVQKELDTVSVNVAGFTAMATVAANHLIKEGSGQLVGISSIACLRGSHMAPSYNASKAYISNFLEGISVKMFKSGLPVFVTDIRPGFVDTRMAQGEGLFWVAPTEKAANQIWKAIQNKRRIAYVTKRWKLISWLLKLLPFSIYKKI
jgi:short-subunit dehydrogenase